MLCRDVSDGDMVTDGEDQAPETGRLLSVGRRGSARLSESLFDDALDVLEEGDKAFEKMATGGDEMRTIGSEGVGCTSEEMITSSPCSDIDSK